jgi:hypothetical protein
MSEELLKEIKAETARLRTETIKQINEEVVYYLINFDK